MGYALFACAVLVVVLCGYIAKLNMKHSKRVKDIEQMFEKALKTSQESLYQQGFKDGQLNPRRVHGKFVSPKKEEIANEDTARTII